MIDVTWLATGSDGTASVFERLGQQPCPDSRMSKTLRARTTIPAVSIVIESVVATGFCAATMTGTNTAASSAGSASWPRRLAPGKEMLRADLMPACHLRHDRARRKRFRDDPPLVPLVRVTPPSPATNATPNLDAPSRRGSVNYMVDHICEPMPSTGSHLPNYELCRSLQDRGKTPLTPHSAQPSVKARAEFRECYSLDERKLSRSFIMSCNLHAVGQRSHNCEP
jgi:hypothetical protein